MLHRHLSTSQAAKIREPEWQLRCFFISAATLLTKSFITMKRIFVLAALAILMHPGIDAQENFLTASDSLNTSLPIDGSYSAIEVIRDSMYAIGGTTIYIMDLENDFTVDHSTLPDESYSGFPSFITLSPDEESLWVGFTTSDNSDDRIYQVDRFDKTWEHIATMPANFDLAFWKGQALLTGLNSISWSDPSGIWLLDESGDDEHRLIIATGGYSAGLDTDEEGNVYYATSYFSENALLKWHEADVSATIESLKDTLKVEAATVLASLPAGAYDLDLDAAENIVFNCNNFVLNFIGAIKGSTYDTLATTDLFLTRLAARGDILNLESENQVYAQAYGAQIAEVHHDIQPLISDPITDLSIYTNETEDRLIDLYEVFHDDDDHDSIFIFTLLENSNPDMITSTIEDHTLSLALEGSDPGYAEIVVEAASHVYTLRDTVGITLSFPLGLAQNDPALAIMVYPNPASEFVKITGQDLKNGMVSIIDMLGRTLLKQEYKHADEAINISSLKPGSYLLVLNKNGHQYHTRILKR